MKKLLLSLVLPCALILVSWSSVHSASPRFIPLWVFNYTYTPPPDFPLPASEVEKIAKYDLSDLHRWYYRDDAGRNTWSVIKSTNPNHEIYVYECGYATVDYQDAWAALYTNTISRWNNARGHSMGNLNVDRSYLFLLDSLGNRIQDSFGNWLLDFGHPDYVPYWVGGVTADIIPPWKADGVWIDGGLSPPVGSSLSTTYPTAAAWQSAYAAYISAATSQLHARGFKAFWNGGGITSSTARQVWIDMDNSADPPDVLAEEAPFAANWVAGSLVAFLTEAEIKNAIDTMQAVSRIRVAVGSHSKGKQGDPATWAGVDSPLGRAVTYWDGFYFALSCFLLGKNTVANNSYFFWHDDETSIPWFDEYDYLNLGSPVSTYQISNHGSVRYPVNIYWREFEKGYVYVNPTRTDVTGIALAGSSRRVSHDNVKNPFGDPVITTLDLNAYRAAILVKSSVTSWSPPSVTGSSDSGSNSSCFIATAAYGSYLDPHVIALRDFRDSYLLTNVPGRWFVTMYYRYSPPIASFIGEHENVKGVTRWVLTTFVYSVKYPGAVAIIVLVGLLVAVIERGRKD